ncbi:serine hydrolase [Gordonia phage Epsocamisio]|nr:serine hydrolase [Gordonia phage Epsocamisio]
MKRILGGIIASIIAASAAATIGAAPAQSGGCPAVAHYAIGGYQDTDSNNVPNVPAGWRMNIHYPADVLRADYSRKVAGDKLEKEARHMRATCPGTRIGIYGYSLGASAGSLVVDRWQTQPYMAQNTYAVFFGNPRHQVGPDGWGGIEAAGLPHLPGGVYTWYGPRKSGPIPVTDFCTPRRDFVCSSPVPLHKDLIGAFKSLEGYWTGGHAY